ncbi:MAG: hypothetical protein ACOY45_13590 [Pseudomonadota bacterium]
MSWVQLGGSIVAILLLAGFAWVLGLGRDVRIADADEARALTEALIPGFRAARVWLAADGRHALVVARHGPAALLRPNGAHFVARRVERIAFPAPDRATVHLAGEAPYRLTLPAAEDAAALAAMAGAGAVAGTGAVADTGVSERV